MKKVKLTKKKLNWYNTRPSKNIAKGLPLIPNVDIYKRMEKDLVKLVEQMNYEVKRDLIKLFKSDNHQMTMDADISSSARILLNALSKKFADIFNKKGMFITQSMITNTDKTVSSNVHQSLAQLSGGLKIKTSNISEKSKTIMKASAAESAGLIKTIQAKYLEAISGVVFRSITQGQGLKEVVPFIDNLGEVTKRRAKNIALDQTRKVYTAVSTNKMQEAGITHFEWIHSHSSAKPRDEHLAHDGKIFAFNDLPLYNGKPDYPSWQPFCRCFARPVIKFEENT